MARRTAKRKTTRRRKNPGITDIASAIELLQAMPGGSKRKKNPAAFIKARGVRFRRAGGRTLVDVLR